MQLSYTVPPEALFSDYLYFSSVSDAFVAHAKAAAEAHHRNYSLGANSFVLEIASNDGYLLQNFVRLGVPCLGVEPAANIAKVAVAKGVSTLSEFFSSELARRIVGERGQADLILGNNVFAHVPNTNDFVEGLATLLAPNGRIVLEFPWAHEMVKNLEFDTIYHEHVFYFHATSLVPLLARHGLEMVQIQKLAIHGGSLRVHIAHEGVAKQDPDVADILAKEASAGVGDLEYGRKFRENVLHLRQQLNDEIARLKSAGSKVAAYGASAKGSTLLNFFGIGRESLDFVVDRSPHKQGRFTPGTHLPIFDPEALNEHKPDVTLLLTWNFAEEIAKQQTSYIQGGGRFLVPLPQPHYLP
jgi:SAM-dependent methyltransferase